MSALRRLSLRTRVAALLAGLTVVLLLVGVVTTLAVQRTRSLDGDVRNRLQPASDAVQRLYLAYVDQETGVRGYLISRDDGFLKPYDEGTKQAADDVLLLRTKVDDAQVLADLGRVVALHQTWLANAAEPELAAAKGGRVPQAERIASAKRAKTDFDAIRTAITAMQTDVGRVLDRARNSADAASQRVYYALGVGAFALLVAIVVTGWLLRRWILTPTSRLQRQLRQVADGGYDLHITPSGPPELAAVAGDAELMRERIVTELDRSRRAIEALYQSGPVVTGLREELAATPAVLLPGLALHGVLMAAEGVLAGDWYDAVALDDGRTAVVVADVSGHGAAAGLVALRLKMALTSALSLGLGPAAALAHATASFAREEERFASCVVVVIDPVGEKLAWANAGHPPPLIYTPASGEDEPECTELEPTGPLLSFIGGEWDERSAAFRHGQVLLGYTDGLPEARDEHGRQLELDGVVEALASLHAADPVAAVVACLSAVRSHAADLRRDDVTVVAVAHEE